MRRVPRPTSTLALLLCVSCSNIAGCERAAETPAAEGAAPIQVRVVPVRRGDIADVLSVTGETAALSILRLASPVAGRVTMLKVQPGDRLGAGDVAARVIPLENEAALHGFAMLEDADALGADEKTVARHLRKKLTGRDIALRVPFPAVVAERLRNPGEQVAPNDVLLEVFDPGSLYVLAQVPVEAARRVSVGMPVTVIGNGTVVAGQVSALAGALAPQTLTVPVRVSLTTPLQPAFLRAAVDCRITVAQHVGALLIPRSALISSTAAERATVAVVIDGHVQQRTIQLGLRTTSEVEVRDGLGAGELVVSEGQYALPDGTRIQPFQGAAE